jgi:hypothetical protein
MKIELKMIKEKEINIIFLILSIIAMFLLANVVIQSIDKTLIGVIYFILLIIQVYLLFKTIKINQKKYEIILFALEIFSIIFAIFIWHYYKNLAKEQLIYLGYGNYGIDVFAYFEEFLASFWAIAIYSFMIFMTILKNIIITINNRKKLNTKNKNFIK